MNHLNKLMERLGHQFNNLELLKIALTHRSSGADNNERLEFLGDSVLGFIIASELYQRRPQAREGDLSRMRASMVNGDELAQMSTKLGINEYLQLGVGEQKSGGKRRRSILADALEAIVGSIYIDAGLETCRRCVLNWYGERVDDLSKLSPKKDAKSLLQEWLQARRLPLPTYEVKITGEAHAQTFTVNCYVKGLPHKTEGVNTTRRRAEQIAAKRFLELLDDGKGDGITERDQ
ncbi:ribonuclease III [Coxiella burnetii]|uniref:Ribonuclease 3 n=1 Tax=Coxiella burnetii (strain CbuG_Q212) TaxID=434923 RepID=RNC_COXB2|nr:ribonuclease III [Coxiella burnetii]B6IYZ9.1 RecName: Full=Ribonuclease 3; AltName: Full=Ribonuclease III; Short=RNase III [Coxiella burnetii CbuG_Q212]ACJ17927.1 ribonuclease III [Coxiella burnetii CbuG_Q212]ATN66349.1 ribonuclease III [Coxiella burnetii]OYK86715.1 ribonuclease 3 [Coxiella burnetii]